MAKLALLLLLLTLGVALQAVVVPVDAVIRCGGVRDIVIVLDGSGSLDPDQWTQEKSFASLIVDELQFGTDLDRVAFVQFSQSSSSFEESAQFELTGGSTTSAPTDASYFFSTNATIAKQAIGTATQREGGTNCVGGLTKAAQLFALTDRGVPQLVVFMTDGACNRLLPTDSADVDTVTMNAALTGVSGPMRANGVSLLGIAIVNGVVEQLELITGSPQSVFTAATFDDLANNLDDILGASCCENCEQGSCDYQTGICFCDTGFAGTDCSSELLCPDNCNAHGTCKIKDGEAECRCWPSYSGLACENNYGGPMAAVVAGLGVAALGAAGVLFAFHKGVTASGLVGAMKPAPMTHMTDTNMTTASTPGTQQDKPLMSPASRSVPMTVKNPNAAFTIL